MWDYFTILHSFPIPQVNQKFIIITQSWMINFLTTSLRMYDLKKIRKLSKLCTDIISLLFGNKNLAIMLENWKKKKKNSDWVFHRPTLLDFVNLSQMIFNVCSSINTYYNTLKHLNDNKKQKNTYDSWCFGQLSCCNNSHPQNLIIQMCECFNEHGQIWVNMGIYLHCTY